LAILFCFNHEKEDNMKNIMPSASSRSQFNKQYETAIITFYEVTTKGRKTSVPTKHLHETTDIPSGAPPSLQRARQDLFIIKEKCYTAWNFRSTRLFENKGGHVINGWTNSSSSGNAK
jgi:hypothetical protein